MVANLYNAGRRIYHGGMENKVVTTKEAAELIGVHQDTVRRWVRNGVISSEYVMKVGKTYLIHTDGLPSEEKRPARGRPKKS